MATGHIEDMLDKPEIVVSGPASSTLVMVQSDEVHSIGSVANTRNGKETLDGEVNDAVFFTRLPDYDLTDTHEVEELKLKLKTVCRF